MDATTHPWPEGRPPSPSGFAGRLPRFDRNERLLHWANAGMFLVLMATAAMLYIGPLSAVVGRRVLVRNIHVWTGVALPLPYLVARIGPWSAQLRADVRRLARFDAHDRRFVRTLGRDSAARLGKFHPGQKLNAAFTAGAIPVLLGTGVVMHWFDPFPLAWRTGATFVHDWVALGVFVAVSIHIVKATSDRQAMSGMWGGTVSDRWARRHHPRWHEELTAGLTRPPPTALTAETVATECFLPPKFHDEAPMLDEEALDGPSEPPTSVR